MGSMLESGDAGRALLVLRRKFPDAAHD